MENSDVQKSAAWDVIDKRTPELSEFHHAIWDYAETAWREYRSARAYTELLRREGFDVEVGSGQMPTAFVARWGTGGPLLGAYAEYDAVPHNNQAPVPRREPRPDRHPFAPGHTDPHSALGVGALAGVLAAKAVMERERLPGRLVFFGEPAEKVCGSKPVHAAKGYYDGFDAFVSYHPYLANTAEWDTHNGCYWSAVFTFVCDEPRTWNLPNLIPIAGKSRAVLSSHVISRSPGALDALMMMYTATKYTKENMFPHTASWTLCEAILANGSATSDNLSPRFAQIQYAWRSPTLEIQQQIFRVLEENARAAAAVTNCTPHVRWVTKTRMGLRNHTLARATYANLTRVGPPVWGEEARAFARACQEAEGLVPDSDPFVPQATQLTDPEEWEAESRAALPPWQEHVGADDYVEYTWHAPTVRFFTAKPSIRGLAAWAHWANNAANGVPALIDPTWITGAKTIAATLMDLVTQPELLARARAEFEERTGGGVGGTKWIPPQLPRDFSPPVDLPWPEYSETPRGFDWYLPRTHTFGESLSR